MRTPFGSLCSAAILLSLAGPGAVAEPAGKGPPLSLQGTWLRGGKSLCEVEPAHPPKSLNIGAGGGWTVAGCSDLDRRGLVPLLGSASNRNPTEPVKFILPLLNEIALRQGKSSVPAEAFYVAWGAPKGFATELKGNLELDIPPGARVEFIYLFPKVEGESKLYLKGRAWTVVPKR